MESTPYVIGQAFNGVNNPPMSPGRDSKDSAIILECLRKADADSGQLRRRLGTAVTVAAICVDFAIAVLPTTQPMSHDTHEQGLKKEDKCSQHVNTHPQCIQKHTRKDLTQKLQFAKHPGIDLFFSL